MKDFPFKTLIWAAVTMFTLFLFREPLAEPFRNMEEIIIFEHFTMKVKKSDISALQEVEQKYNDQIKALSDNFISQQTEMNKIQELNKQLQKEISKCKPASDASSLLEAKYKEASKNDLKIKSQIEQLSKFKVLKIPMQKVTVVTGASS